MADDVEKCAVEGCEEPGTILLGGGGPEDPPPRWYCERHAIPLLDYAGHKLLGRRAR